MASTPIYNWPTPDNTDLVKNGALAIRTLGDAIDTTMDTMIPETIFAAKGDLLGASANDTPAVLSVGANGETLVADSSTSTGLRWQGDYAAGKNKIINGDFGIWQRGTSFTATGYLYTADRWVTYGYTTNTTTVSRQTFTLGTAPVAGYEGTYFCRINSSNTNTYIGQRIEDVRTFANQTVTISLWAKSASAITNLTLGFAQVFGSGGSATVGTNFTTTGSVGTSWSRISVTGTVPSISGKTIGTDSFLILDIVSATLNNNLDIWGVQVEAGSVATAFQTATGTIQGELAACQRYYQRFTIDTDGHTGFIGNAYLTTASSVTRGALVSMRTTPSSVDFSNVTLYDGVTFFGITGLTIWAATESHTFALLATGATGLTQYRSYFLLSSGAAGFVALNAEL
jgi:hypothetical protein